MKNFIVRDIKGLFSDWNFDGYVVNGKELTSRYHQEAILDDISKLKPVTIYQDGTVNGVDGGRSIDIVTDSQGFTDFDFQLAWVVYGDTSQAISA